MTVRDIARRLRNAGIENAAEEALLVAAHVTSLSPDCLRVEQTLTLPDPDGALERLVARRESREPLQYLLGLWYFWRQEYEVSPDCLIPRPDTETLVEYAVKYAPRGGRVLDLCTGSGCIAISLLCERPDLTAVAVDLYENTLSIAHRNAARNGIGADRLTLLQGDVLVGDFLEKLGRFDMILSNPPYIPSATVAMLAPELAYEPRAALDGGGDGLVFYRRMLEPDYLSSLGDDGCLAFEIGCDQGEALRALAGKHACNILRDLGGHDRVAVVTPCAYTESTQHDTKE